MVPADSLPRPATSPGNVEVYASGEPAVPFTEVALLLAQHGDRPELVDALRQRCADLGGDVLIVDTEIPQISSHSVAMDAPAWWVQRYPGARTYVPATQHELDGTCAFYDR